MKPSGQLRRTGIRRGEKARKSQIRMLRDNEPIPESEPKRYRSQHGYIRLRWLVGTQQYVEAYEHRINAGRPAPWLHVHHINGDKTDNRPENLEVLTAEEHGQRHAAEMHGEDRRRRLPKAERRPRQPSQYAPYRGRAAMEKAQRRIAREAARRAEVDRMRELYQSGLSTYEVGQIIGIDESNVYRRLKAAEVAMRTTSDYAAVLDEQEIVEKYQAGRSLPSLGREYRVTARRITEVLEAAGVPRRKPGRSSNRAHEGENRAREIVYARSRRCCERCGQAKASEWHHRRNRSQQGKWRASNGLDLCVPCHLAVTNTNGHRAEYERDGWIVPSRKNPTDVPVWMWYRGQWGKWLLDDQGTAVPAPQEAA